MTKAKPQPAARAPWERRDFNVRLSKRRAALLRQLADEMAPGATPCQALDEALRLATSSADVHPSGMAELAAELDEGRRDAEARHLEAMSELRALRETMEALRQVLQAAADAEL